MHTLLHAPPWWTRLLPQGRRWLAGIGLALAWLPAAADGTVVTLNSRVLDLYGPGSPGTQQDSLRRSGDAFGDLGVEAWRETEATRWAQGGLAFARSEWRDHDLLFGTSALARSGGGFNGDASATLDTAFELKLFIDMGTDPLSVALFSALASRGNCCRFDVGFVHTTHGRLAYAHQSGDRRALFQETLTLGPVTVFGQVDMSLRNGSPLASVQTRGAWSPADLTAFGPTPASQLALFPAGDLRNALNDPLGDLRGFDFLHTEVITLPLYFGIEGLTSLTATIPVRLQQAALAGIGGPVFSWSTLSVDFADTSTLAPTRLSDPLGELDLSALTLQFRQVSPVPEPATAWLLLAGSLLLLMRRRR